MLICHSYVYSREVAVQIFCVFYWVICLFIIELWVFFIYPGYQPLVRFMFCKYFLSIYSLPIYFLNSIFYEYKFLILVKFNLSIFYGYCFLWPKETSHPLNHKDILLYFSLKVYRFSFNLVFCMIWGRGQVLVFPYKYPVLSEPFVEKTSSPPYHPLDCFGIFIRKQMSI